LAQQKIQEKSCLIGIWVYILVKGPHMGTILNFYVGRLTMENCRLLYEPESINWPARSRVEMLSYRPPEILTPEPSRRYGDIAAAVFCGLAAAGLAITWIWFVR